MKVGDMRHRVSIYGTTTTDDGMGGQTTESVLKGIYWAKLTALTGYKNNTDANESYKVEMRNVGVGTGDVIVTQYGTLTIHSIKEDYKGEWQTIEGWAVSE